MSQVDFDLHALRERDLPTPEFHLANQFASKADCPRHVHAGIELVLVRSGRCVIYAGDEPFEGRPGMLIVLPANVAQVQRTFGFTRTTYVVFQASPLLFDDSARTLRIEKRDWGERWMDELCELDALAVQPSPKITDALVMVLLQWINEVEAKRRGVSRIHPSLAKAVEFIEAHLTEPVDVPTVAAAAHCSASHLTALFRRQLRRGPKRYQQDLRMAMARRLLRNPYLNVGEVAEQCGYEDIGYFVRQFRKCHGRPPGRWRARASPA